MWRLIVIALCFAGVVLLLTGRRLLLGASLVAGGLAFGAASAAVTGRLVLLGIYLGLLMAQMCAVAVLLEASRAGVLERSNSAPEDV